MVEVKQVSCFHSQSSILHDLSSKPWCQSPETNARGWGSYSTLGDVEVRGELSGSEGRESEHASSGGLHFVRVGNCLNESSKLN